MKNFLYKTLSLKPNEWRLLALSTSFILLLFAAYATLRPLRDALGISGDNEELKWLFLGTFIATLLGSIAAMWLGGNMKKKLYVDAIFIFFALNLLGFFVALKLIDEADSGFLILSRIFYIWASVFNLFIISSAWSVLADVFSKDRSKRLFGIVSAGASLGSIIGSALVSVLSKHIALSSFIGYALALLALGLVVKTLLLRESYRLLESGAERDAFKERLALPIGSKNPFSGLALILKSRYLLLLLCFILLLTSVSTFLYMEQARIIKALFPTKEARIAAFANIDFIVQSLSFLIQIFLTAKIAEFLGLKWLLSMLGFVLCVGFVILAFTHPLFLPFIIVMCVRRVGEYALIKPGREMCFVPLDSESKYKVKNFLDTVVYRGGDALSAQLEGALAKCGIAVVLLSGALIAFVWGILGFKLAKKYEQGDFD